MKKFSLFLTICLLSLGMHAQLYIDNATFFIQNGATVTVQGDITSNVDIQVQPAGTGKILLKGSANQNITMNGFTIPNLEMDNAANATLLSNARIGSSMLFTTGKILHGNFNMRIADVATITGQSSARFFQINGTGQLIKEISSNLAGYELPVGEGTNYRPAYLTTTGTYAAATFGVRVLGAANANNPPTLANYLQTNWPVTRAGITGTASLSGQYIDPTDVIGTEANLVGYYNSGTDWTSVGETHNTATNQVGAPVTTASGVVSGFNKFLAVGSRAYLQGAYVAAAGTMADNLRTLPFGSSASTANFPSTDPYRIAPYLANFPHTNNTNVETIPNAAVLDQAGTDDDIVDWVFLELRATNASPGNTLYQTRAALIQRDGDIVDVDGVSPVTFNGSVGTPLADGNYIVTVRHRNHLGLGLDQGTPKNFTETKSLAYTAGRVADFRTATDLELFGTSAAFATATHPTLTTINVLWGGNGTGNFESKYQGPGNDRALILTDLSGVELATPAAGYFRSDLNMNRLVRYQSPGNDRAFLLATVLASIELTTRTQVIPN